MKHKSYEYSHEGVYQSVLTQALGLKVPEGWAKQIAEQVTAEMIPGKGGIGLYSWGIHVDTGKYSRWNG